MCIKNHGETKQSLLPKAAEQQTGFLGGANQHQQAQQPSPRRDQEQHLGLGLRKSSPGKVLAKTSANNNGKRSNNYATKVRKLVQYEGGKLENILLPILVATSNVVTVPQQQQGQQDYHPHRQQQQHQFFEYGSDDDFCIEDANPNPANPNPNPGNPNPNATAKATQPRALHFEGEGEPPIEIKQEEEEAAANVTNAIMDYQEYEGSEADEKEFYYDNETEHVARGDNKQKFKANGNANSIIIAGKNEQQQNKKNQVMIKIGAGFVKQEEGVQHVQVQQQQVQGTTEFIRTLLHSLDCNSCDASSCKKMRLVLGHYLSCRKGVSMPATTATATRPATVPTSRVRDGCRLCQQLLSIVSRHAAVDCVLPIGRSCPVPMCDVMRAERMATQQPRA